MATIEMEATTIERNGQHISVTPVSKRRLVVNVGGYYAGLVKRVARGQWYTSDEPSKTYATSDEAVAAIAQAREDWG